MDILKIGKFIQKKRKEKNLTQFELAERLSITDRAVSKWECGRSLPDSSIMLKLCEVLDIRVTELLTGEELKMEEIDHKAEENLLEIIKAKEMADKNLLRLEVVLGIIGTLILVIMFLVGTLTYYYLDLPLWAMILMFSTGFVVFIITMLFSIFIETKAGYYECQECHQKYIPTYSQVLFAPHINRTRYMKCPHCKKRSWNKKVISK